MGCLKLSDGASLMHILLWIHTNILGIGTILTFDYDRLCRKGRTGNCNTLKGKEYNGQISNLNFWLGTRNIMEIRIYIGTKNEKSFIKFEKLTEFTELVLECIVWGPESEDMSTFSPMNKCTLRHMSHNWHHQKKWCQNNMLFLYVHTSTFFLSINHIHVLRIQCIRTESNKFGILLRCHTLIIGTGTILMKVIVECISNYLSAGMPYTY